MIIGNYAVILPQPNGTPEAVDLYFTERAARRGYNWWYNYYKSQGRNSTAMSLEIWTGARYRKVKKEFRKKGSPPGSRVQIKSGI